jgi:hypothetical protein
MNRCESVSCSWQGVLDANYGIKFVGALGTLVSFTNKIKLDAKIYLKYC